MTRLPLFETAARHLRLALRTLLRNRGAAFAAIGIPALGIGMSVAMFSLVNAVLLRPLPFPDQQSIQVIWKTDPLAGTHVEELAYPELGDLQRSIPDLAYAAVMPTTLYGYARVLQTGQAAPVQIESSPVSHDFFRVLGVSPALGRDFTGSDEQVGAAPVVMLSDRVWRDHLGANPRIVGQMIRLNGKGHNVIGVMAPGVEFPRGAGLWIPLGTDAGVVNRRGATFLQAIVRMKPGASPTRLALQVNALFKRLSADYPEAYTRSQRGVVTSLMEYWAGSARQHLWIMLSASLLLFAASAISAGNLLLSRTLARRTEFALRLALGARPRQILAQLAAEGALVAAGAVVIGLALAQAVIRFLVMWAPSDIPRLADAGLDLPGFCFAACAALLAAVGCTVIPGWSALTTSLEPALREGGARSSLSGRGAATRNAFVLVQATVTVMLLSLASLLVLGYRAMMSADTGLANRDAVTMNLQLRGPGLFAAQGFDLNTRRAFYTRLLDKLRQAPGVTSAAAILLRPLEGTIGWDVTYQFPFEEAAKDVRVLPKANFEVITPGYFATVGTPMLDGRDFSERDSTDAEPVVIISRSLAQRIRAAGFSPLGYPVRLGLGPRRWTKVVGICADARYRSITRTGSDIFVPSLQATPSTNYVVIRGTASTQTLTALVRRSLQELDASQVVAGVATIGELIDANSARHRFNMILLLWFGICAAILAATGVYSVITETMAARRREIAIRMALGSQRTRLVRDMVRRTVIFVVMGELLGVFLVSTVVRAMSSELLYGVSARDPVILGSVAAMLLAVSVASAFWPAWFAAGGDPRTGLNQS